MMADSTLQIELTSSASISAGATVVFNTIVYSSGNISYNNSTGEITLQDAGCYLVNWWMATQSSALTNGAALALSSSQGDLLGGNSPIKAGEVYGVGVIDVSIAPVTLSLINSGTATMYLSAQTPLQGSLVVTSDNPNGETGPTGPTGPTGADGGFPTAFGVRQLTSVSTIGLSTTPITLPLTTQRTTSEDVIFGTDNVTIQTDGTYFVLIIVNYLDLVAGDELSI